MACLSVAEYLGGGLALATVALIAVSSAHIARPEVSVPEVPLHYATAAIDTSEAVAKLSLEPSAPNETPGATRDKRVSDVGTDAAVSRSIAPNVATVPPPAPPSAAADHATPLTARWPVELGMIDAGSLGRSADAMWDLRSHGSPPNIGSADSLQRNVPNPPRVPAAPTFVGSWTDDIGRCRTDKKTPLVISPRAARTAYGECDFGSVVREAANRWRVAAICTADGQFWRAHIALKLVEASLTWSSERGTETYVRCKR